MIVDSHCHLDRLDLTDHDGSLESALTSARDKGVGHFLCVCIDLEHFDDVLTIAKSHTDICASVGVHPTSEDVEEPSLEKLIHLASDENVVAIGETGLDFYRQPEKPTWQIERFETHIEAAKATNKPLIIHTRMAREDTIASMKTAGADQAGGVMHCFTEDWEMAKKAIDLNFYISFSGIVTFKNATELKEVAKKVPLDRMLIETDSPYLAPVPHRGKSNEPAYVYHVAEYLSELKGVPFETLAQQTTDNYTKLFGISLS